MRQINLLPETLQKAHIKTVIVHSAAVSIGGTFLLAAVVHVLLTLSIGNLEERVLHPASYLDTMEFAQLREMINIKAEEVKKYVGQYGTVVEAQMNNNAAEGILKAAGMSSKHKVWFTRFVLDNKARKCEIEGKSFNTRLVSEFMLNIKKSPFFDNVSLISMEKGTDEKVDFKVVCILK